MTKTKLRLCVDCPPPVRPSAARPAPYAGPRCSTHNREVIKARRKKAHEAHVMKTYQVSEGFYDRLYKYQDGHCAICPARGLKKRLGVDHDHKIEGIDNVRGLLCLRCNQVLARFRDDPELFQRAIAYLRDPPAQRLLMAED